MTLRRAVDPESHRIVKSIRWQYRYITSTRRILRLCYTLDKEIRVLSHSSSGARSCTLLRSLKRYSKWSLFLFTTWYTYRSFLYKSRFRGVLFLFFLCVCTQYKTAVTSLRSTDLLCLLRSFRSITIVYLDPNVCCRYRRFDRTISFLQLISRYFYIFLLFSFSFGTLSSHEDSRNRSRLI